MVSLLWLAFPYAVAGFTTLTSVLAFFDFPTVLTHLLMLSFRLLHFAGVRAIACVTAIACIPAVACVTAVAGIPDVAKVSLVSNVLNVVGLSRYCCRPSGF
jgi:hypothetical protein